MLPKEFSFIKQRRIHKQNKDMLYDLWHMTCCVYGYIPFNRFVKEFNVRLMYKMIPKISKEYQDQKQFMAIVKKFMGYKGK